MFKHLHVAPVNHIFIFLSPHSEWRHHPEVKLLSSQDFLCAIPTSASSWSCDGEVVSRPVRHSCVWTFSQLPWILQLLSGPLSDVNLDTWCKIKLFKSAFLDCSCSRTPKLWSLFVMKQSINTEVHDHWSVCLCLRVSDLWFSFSHCYRCYIKMSLSSQ